MDESGNRVSSVDCLISVGCVKSYKKNPSNLTSFSVSNSVVVFFRNE